MMRTRTALALAMIAFAAPTACIGSKTEPAQEEKEPPADVKQYIVDLVPADVTRLDINFDDKLTLVGVKIEPSDAVIEPGKKVKLSYYWRVDKQLDAGWKLFTHVYDASGERLMNIDNVGPLRRWRRNDQSWPPPRWLAGKVYIDTQSFTMPRKVKTSTIQVSTGIWRDDQRVPIKSGPSLKDNRALVATLKTTFEGAPAAATSDTKAPRVDVVRLKPGLTPRIDGKLDDAAWVNATSTGPFVNVETGAEDPKSPVQGSAKLAWDELGMYIAFEVKDQDLTGGFDKKPDQQLWTKDTVEVMIDPEGDGDNNDYYEIQVNPQNLVFDSHFDSYNRPMELPNGPFGHQDWQSGVKSAVTVNGTLDDAKDRDEGYVVEMKIPWTTLRPKDKPDATLPKPGARWRINLYAMQNNGGVAWSPILGQGNFHKASRFAYVTWLTEPAAATPPTTAPVLLDPATMNKARSAPAPEGNLPRYQRSAEDLPTVPKERFEQAPVAPLPKPEDPYPPPQPTEP